MRAALLFGCAIALFVFAQIHVEAIPQQALQGGGVANGGGGGSITVGANWGSTSCGSPTLCNANSGTKTLTVPGGTGTIKFTKAPTSQLTRYNKNGAGLTSFSNNDTLGVSNGDTLSLQGQSLPCDNGTVTITVKDDSTGATIGTFTGTNTTGC